MVNAKLLEDGRLVLIVSRCVAVTTTFIGSCGGSLSPAKARAIVLRRKGLAWSLAHLRILMEANILKLHASSCRVLLLLIGLRGLGPVKIVVTPITASKQV